MSKPAIHSFVSLNGPSVTSTCPRLTLTVTASLTGRRASPVTRLPWLSTFASHCSKAALARPPRLVDEELADQLLGRMTRPRGAAAGAAKDHDRG